MGACVAVAEAAHYAYEAAHVAVLAVGSSAGSGVEAAYVAAAVVAAVVVAVVARTGSPLPASLQYLPWFAQQLSMTCVSLTMFGPHPLLP